MQEAEIASNVSPIVTAIGQILGVMVVISGGYVVNHFKGGKRDTARKRELAEQLEGVVEKIDARTERRLTTVQRAIDTRFDTVEANVAEVRSFCVGPDGKNGFRKDIQELKEGLGREIGEVKESVARNTERIDQVEARERDRLEHELNERRLDRRAAS